MISEERQRLSLVLVVQNHQVLLGCKKTGFGAGRWNALGGKIEAFETPLEGALRELQEECGLEASRGQEVARVFVDYLHTGRKVELFVFRVEEITGTLCETSEMNVDWILIEEVPYQKMWVNDQYWLPFVLNGKTLRARFVFQDDETLIEKDIEFTSSF